MNYTKVGVIDYGISNIASVINAIALLNIDIQLITHKKDFKNCSHIILPGVGSFAAGMRNIIKMDLFETIRNEANAGKPLLGICLGMQLLAELGQEVETQNGLGLIPGKIVKLNLSFQNHLKLPHMGWNQIQVIQKSRYLQMGVTDNSYYFAHSYIYQPIGENWVTAICQYGEDIPAIIEKNNIVGFQFHPEKSQLAGLDLLKRFICSKPD